MRREKLSGEEKMKGLVELAEKGIIMVTSEAVFFTPDFSSKVASNLVKVLNSIIPSPTLGIYDQLPQLLNLFDKLMEMSVKTYRLSSRAKESLDILAHHSFETHLREFSS